MIEARIQPYLQSSLRRVRFGRLDVLVSLATRLAASLACITREKDALAGSRERVEAENSYLFRRA